MQLNFNLGKFFLPGIEQFHRVAAGHREQQFKILAVGQRGGKSRFGRGTCPRPQPCRAADRNRRFEQFRADATGLQNVPQIAGQAVAQINHRVNGKMFRQPARLGQSRLKFQMFACQRTAQFAGHKNRIAGLCAGTEDLFSPRDRAEQRDGNENAVRVRRRFAADNRHAVFSGQRAHAVINFADKLRLEMFRQPDGHQRGGRLCRPWPRCRSGSGRAPCARFFPAACLW